MTGAGRTTRSARARPTQSSSRHARRRTSRMTVTSPFGSRSISSSSSTVNGWTSAISSALSASDDGTVATTTNSNASPNPTAWGALASMLEGGPAALPPAAITHAASAAATAERVTSLVDAAVAAAPPSRGTRVERRPGPRCRSRRGRARACGTGRAGNGTCPRASRGSASPRPVTATRHGPHLRPLERAPPRSR